MNTTIWIETNVSSLDHGGDKWEHGRCLWSPSQNKKGADIYSLMRHCKRGDLVIHIRRLNGVPQFVGTSRVLKPYRECLQSPPNPGKWANMAPYYRVELIEYTGYTQPLNISVFLSQYREELLEDLIGNKAKYYPFIQYKNELRLGQGSYITQCTPILYSLINDALSIEYTAIQANLSSIKLHQRFLEGKRTFRETRFFARNHNLVKKAKEYYGSVCMACGFDFHKVYGELGAGYCECHHLNPLSARSSENWFHEISTSIEEIAILCANCHRMVHQNKEILALEELKTLIQTNSRSKP